MKKLFWFFLILSLTVNLYLASLLVQRPTSKPSVAQVDMLNRTTDKIYFIGNSITKGGAWAELLQDGRIENMAIPGITSIDAVMMLNDLLPDKPAAVFLMLGINDIKSEMEQNMTMRNIFYFIKTIKRISPATKVNLMSVLPVNEHLCKYPITNEQVLKLNEQIKDMCLNFHLKYVDLYHVLLDGENQLGEKYTVDGLHLNKEAYIELCKILKSSI